MERRCTLVAAALAALAPPGTAVAVIAVGAAPETAYAEERSAIARAVPARRMEFNAGREAARQALIQLGVGALPIPSGPHRMPLWPAGVTGSITHAQGVAAAMVAHVPDGRGRAIGLDLDGNHRAGGDLARAIAAPGEALSPAATSAFRAAGICADTLRFVAKEAAFKAYFPATRRFVACDGAEADLDAAGRFTVHVRAPGAPPAFGEHRIPGRWIAAGGLLLALALPGDWELPASPASA